MMPESERRGRLCEQCKTRWAQQHGLCRFCHHGSARFAEEQARLAVREARLDALRVVPRPAGARRTVTIGTEVFEIVWDGSY